MQSLSQSGARDHLSPSATLVRRYDRDRFQTALFAAAADREALFTLYAFNYEIARIREIVRETMLGQIRLQWWREVIETAYADGPPCRHEVAEPLTAAIRGRGLSREHFERLIDARERDLDPAPPATLADLESYAEASSAPLIRLALEVLDAATPEAAAAARDVGVAYALAGLLRALPVHAAAGRRWLPKDVATGAGVDPYDAARWRGTSGLAQTIRVVAEAAARRLRAARSLRRAVPRAALPALLPARIAGRALIDLERAGYDPFRRAGEGDPLQSWRLAFAAVTGRF